MSKRIKLDTILRSISTNLYYQPPSNLKLSYPCIVYSLEHDKVSYSNGKKYSIYNQYQITLISKNPDDPIHEKLSNLEFCRFDRRFISDNLYHDVFTIYI